MVFGVEQPGQILLSLHSLVIIAVFFTAMRLQRALRVVERLFHGCFNIEGLTSATLKLDLIENLEAFIFISAGSVLSFAIAQSLDAFKRESSPELLAPLFLVAATIGFVSLWRSVWGDVRREPVIYATVSLLFGFVAFAALETGLVADTYWPPVAEAAASGATKLNQWFSHHKVAASLTVTPVGAHAALAALAALLAVPLLAAGYSTGRQHELLQRLHKRESWKAFLSLVLWLLSTAFWLPTFSPWLLEHIGLIPELLPWLRVALLSAAVLTRVLVARAHARSRMTEGILAVRQLMTTTRPENVPARSILTQCASQLAVRMLAFMAPALCVAVLLCGLLHAHLSTASFMLSDLTMALFAVGIVWILAVQSVGLSLGMFVEFVRWRTTVSTAKKSS